MPIYEYHCQACGQKSTLFLRSFSTTVEPACSHCGSGSLERLISRVAVLHSGQDLFQDYDRTSGMDDMASEDGEGGGEEDREYLGF